MAVPVRISDDLYELLKKEADEQGRKYQKQLEIILTEYYKGLKK